MTELASKLEQLQLTSVARELDHLLADAAAKNLSHAEAIEWLADVELEGRRARSIERRFRLSRLQSKIGIESFDFNHHKTRTQIKSKILRLLDLDFITQGTNVVIIGNSGCGKTQLLHSMYLSEAEASRYGAILVLANTRDVLSDLRDFEFDESRVRPPLLSPSLVTEWIKLGRRVSIFLDELHKAGTHTHYESTPR